MRIGIFGGSFNPLHNAHLQLCAYAMEKAFLDKVILIPTGDNPLKLNDDNIPREHRLTMAQLAVEDLSGFEVSDIEISREGQSYTIDTVKALKAKTKNKNDEYYFISGSDILFQLTWWKNFRGLSNEINFICCARKGVDNIVLLEEAEKINALFNTTVILLEDFSPDEISSSEIRNLIAGQKEFCHLVPKRIYNYIVNNNLYK